MLLASLNDDGDSQTQAFQGAMVPIFALFAPFAKLEARVRKKCKAIRNAGKAISPPDSDPV
jgi:hypothetical protein